MSKSRSRGGSLFFFLIVIIAIIGFATNPSKADFENHIAQEFKSSEQGESTATQVIKKIIAKPIVSISEIEVKDYYIFSTYKIKLMEDEQTYIGVFNHFIQTGGDK